MTPPVDLDRWTYYDVTHRDHEICNPISSERLDRALDALAIRDGERVVDLGCGKGEVLVRLAERARIRGTGVDLSPFSVRDARERVARRVPEAAIEILNEDGAAWRGEAGAFDVAVCLGASWIFGGHRGTLAALARLVRPGGRVLVAEPYWRRQPPDPAWLGVEGVEADTFATHEENAAAGAAAGLSLVLSEAGTPEEFDVYEGLQWRAAERHAGERPGDAAAGAILAEIRGHQAAYQRWGRDGLGQGVYVFRR